MLKLSKRCKSLVALLLLCGCLVVSSSVSFAASSTVIYPWTFYYHNQIVGELKAYFNSLSPSVVSVEHITNISPAVSAFSFETTNHISFCFRNYLEDEYLVLDEGGNFYLQFTVNDTKPSAGANRWTSDTIRFENISDGITILNLIEENPNSSSGQTVYTVLLNFDLRSNADLVIAPKDVRTYSFDIVVSSAYTLSETTSVPTQLNLYQNSNLGKIILSPAQPWHPSAVPASYDSVRLPAAYDDVKTEAAIKDQTTQQQIQLQEQMEQSQQQYEDLTDPGSTEGEEFISGTDNAIKDKIGIFTFIDTLLENLLGLFVPPEGDPTLTFPGFSIEIAGVTHQIWTDHTFNLASLDEDFSALLTAVRFGTVAVVYFALINFLGDTYLRIFAGGKEDD